MRVSPSAKLSALAALALVGFAAGCGKGGGAGSAAAAARFAGLVSREAVPGALSVATKNTTRLGGVDPASDAAAVARAVFPGLTPATRPSVVVLVDENDWPAALAASSLASAPLGAAILYTEGSRLPSVTAQTLDAVRATGSTSFGGARFIAIGAAARAGAHGSGIGVLTAPEGDSLHAAAGAGVAVARVLAEAGGTAPRAVIAVDAEEPRALQMPAAALAAESRAPILFVGTHEMPVETATKLSELHRPVIYLLGAPRLSNRVRDGLRRYGHVIPIEAPAPAGPAPAAAENAIAVSRFGSGGFGWNIHEAGHGLVFASSARPLDAPAAAPLAAHGDYAPLLLVEEARAIPAALVRYLSDIQPAYSESVPPVRAVYNHGWLIGDESAISARVQAELDSMLEVAKRSSASEEAALGPGE